MILLCCCQAGISQTLPTGGQVDSGDATISVDGSTMSINQASQNASIDFDSYNIGSQNTVNYSQPNADSIAFNRVTGQDLSNIMGSLNANGIVYLLNPNGILFGESATINVGGLVAAAFMDDSMDLDNKEAFLEGASGNITNQGKIVAESFAVLAGKEVDNSGSITSVHAALLAGDAIHIDNIGDGQVYLSVNHKGHEEHEENMTTNPLTTNHQPPATDSLAQAILSENPMFQSKVTHSGTIQSPEGKVEVIGNQLSVSGNIESSDGTVVLESSGFVIRDENEQANRPIANSASIIEELDTNVMHTEKIGDFLENNTDLIVRTRIGPGSTSNGNVIFDSDLVVPADTLSLTIEAHNDIILHEDIDFQTNNSPGNLTLKADGIESDGSGGIINGGGIIKMGSGDLILSAATGVGTANTPILTEAHKLDITNTTSDGAFLRNKGELKLSDLNGDGLAQSIQGNSNIQTSSPLTIDANIIQSGEITLQAQGDGGGDDNLSISNNVTQIESTDGGAIRLLAADSVIIDMAPDGVVKSRADGKSTVIITADNGGGTAETKEIQQNSGSIDTVNLALRAKDNVFLNQPNNDFNLLAATSLGGDVILKDKDGFSIGTVDEISGITAKRFITIPGDHPISIEGVDLTTTDEFTGRIDLGQSPIEIGTGPVSIQTAVTENLGRGDIFTGGPITSATHQDLTLTPGRPGGLSFTSIGGTRREDKEIGKLHLNGIASGAARNMTINVLEPLILTSSLSTGGNIDITVQAADLGPQESIPFQQMSGIIFGSLGSVSVTADDISLNGSGISANGNVLLRPNRASIDWIMGENQEIPGTLELSVEEISKISNRQTSARLQIGDRSSSSGTINAEFILLDNQVNSLGLELAAANMDLTINGSLGQFNNPAIINSNITTLRNGGNSLAQGNGLMANLEGNVQNILFDPSNGDPLGVVISNNNILFAPSKIGQVISRQDSEIASIPISSVQVNQVESILGADQYGLLQVQALDLDVWPSIIDIEEEIKDFAEKFKSKKRFISR